MRTNGKQIVDNKVFNLAINLFGFEAPAKQELKETIASQKVALSDDETGMAVYPAIVDEAFSQSMDNYRKYVSVKNFQVSAENELIKSWNQTVRIFRKENNLNEVQTEFSKQFPKTHKNLEPTQYNEKVEEFVKEYGMIVRKKNMITIKPIAEAIFQNMLYDYNKQLMKKNNRFIACTITHKTPIEPYKLNGYKLSEQKRNGVKSLNMCRKTILNHKKRFEEFGVLQNSEFHGWQRATTTVINPEILVFKDLYNQKLTRAENQAVTSQKGKIVPNNNENLTRTFIKESKNEGKVENSSFDKEFPPVTPFNLLFTRTPSSNTEFQTVGAAANVKVLNTPSEIAINTIISDGELAKQLENHAFNNYKPLDIRFLHSLAFNGVLTDEEFYDVAMIDYFKGLQKNIYKKQGVYFGSWYNAIKMFRKQRWVLFNGNVFKKSHIVDEISQYRWRIQWARTWFIKNPNVNPLFPNQYLDVTRKNAKEIGFEFTKIKYKAMLDDNAKYDAILKKQAKQGELRKTANNHNKKLETQLNRFVKNKITLTQLYDYVEKNLPKEFAEKLPDIIETKMLAINQKVEPVKFSLYDF